MIVIHSCRVRSLAALVAPWILGIVFLAAFAPQGLAARQTEEEHVLASDTDYQTVAGTIDLDEIQATIDRLSAIPSRITGYPGCEDAAEYVEGKFNDLGLDDVGIETFPLVVPTVVRDEAGNAATVTVNGETTALPIEPMWPNLVRLPKTPRNGLSGRLIYAHKGSLREFNGLDVTGSIVLLDHNCASEWYNGPLLGATAVLFIEPEETIRGEAEQKFMSMPVDLPRFWVPKEVADHLLGVLQSEDRVDVRLDCDMLWKKVTAKNIVGKITGSDPSLAKETVVLQAYYDSISVVPTKAPGAENACSIASLFQIIKALKAHPPKRTVMFLATSGHFQGLSGSKWFIRNRIRGARQDKRVKRMFELVENSRRDLQEAAERVWEEEPEPTYEEEDEGEEERKTPDQIATERLKALSRLLKSLRTVEKNNKKLRSTIKKARKDDDPNEGIQAERQLDKDEIEDRLEHIDRFDTKHCVIETAFTDAEAAIKGSRDTSKEASLTTKEVALDAAKDAVDEVMNALDLSDQNIQLWISVDLSSHNETFGVFYKGYFYNYSEAIQWKFSDIGKKSREYGELIGDALGVDSGTRLVDGINAIQGKTWSVYMAGKLALSNEVATLAGIPGIGFATVNDSRPQVDTPLDTPEYVNSEAIFRQTQFLACLLCDLISISEPTDLYDLRLDDNFVEVKGRIVRFKPEVSTFPDDPIEGAISVARTAYNSKSCMGVRAEMFDISTNVEMSAEELLKKQSGDRTVERDIFTEGGRIHILGMPNVRARGGEINIDSYALDPDDGRVVMAPDMGVNGGEKYPTAVAMDQDIKPVAAVLFRCEPMAIYDMVDQRFFELLREIYVFDSATDAAPHEYGYVLPMKPQEFTSAYEPVAVVYGSPGTYVKIAMGASVLGLRFILVNPTDENPDGEGYLIERHPSMYATPYRVALDMWRLDDDRINTLVKHGIENSRIQSAHEEAFAHLKQASQHLRAKQYDRFMVSARQAWSFESRAYPDTRKTFDDVIKGVIFYLFLLLPFAFFAERLFLASPEVKWQIVGCFGIFMAVFLLLALVHPAFSISFTAPVILLAFIILSLSIIVISIIVRKFEDQMKEVKYEQTGIHTADVGRLSASAAAFSLGISNLRRRKTRTLLTCITLILLTFTVLSCTSVVQAMRSNRIKLPKEAPYDGILIRDKTWSPIGEPTTAIMRNEYGGEVLNAEAVAAGTEQPREIPVAPRSWYFGARIGQQSFVSVHRGDQEYQATAMVGLSPEERDVWGVDEDGGDRLTKFVKSGRWFEPDDEYACIVPEGMADKLKLDDSDVGNAFVSVFGKDLRVIGIVQSSKLKRHNDLDGEPITPVDYLLMQEQQAQQQASGGERSEDELREYIHLAPDAVLLVPYRFAINVGGSLRSVTIGFEGLEHEEIINRVDNLMERIELNIYAGVGGETYLCSSVQSTSFSGAGDLIIPILIAACIVLNTMLGSVYERTKEIGIYSALGLAPIHIASLFVAEACVYAILGAIAGYLFGQSLSKILYDFGLLQGLNLNYSSLSAVMSTLIIMVTVLLSVIYPAKKASEIAVPGIERRWRLPDPVDDKLDMILPFTVTGDQAMGVNMFLKEFLEAHADYSLGHFSTGDIKLESVTSEGGEGFDLNLMVWLAPYDLGVSERLSLLTVPDPEEDEVFQIRAVIARESGDESSWIRVTRNFVNMLRKQYLLWRTFPAGLKGQYGQRGRDFVDGKVTEDAAGGE